MSFYKTNDPKALATIAAVNEEFGKLQDKAVDFANTIGAKAHITRHGCTEAYIGGYRFEPPKDSKHWTKPDRETKGQKPRLKATGLTAEEKAEHKDLLKFWKDNFPASRVDLRPIYEAIGSDWGSCLINGIAYFHGSDGYFYASTSAKVGEHMQEIFESEYQKAKADRGNKKVPA